MKARDLIRQAAARLPGPSARLDAELLVAHALQVDRQQLLLAALDRDIEPSVVDDLVQRRRHGEPIAYILGEREFWSLPFRVTPDVLIPRPDSETLIESMLRTCPEPQSVLDLGTGSGCLLIAALSECRTCFGVGVDRSIAALGVARANAERLGLSGRSAFFCGDWTNAIAGRFDVILANPPYIAEGEELERSVAGFEPGSALFAGSAGLDCYRAILPELPRILAPSGRAFVEIGHDQAEAVMQLARVHGLAGEIAFDLEERPRCLILGQEQ